MGYPFLYNDRSSAFCNFSKVVQRHLDIGQSSVTVLLQGFFFFHNFLETTSNLIVTVRQFSGVVSFGRLSSHGKPVLFKRFLMFPFLFRIWSHFEFCLGLYAWHRESGSRLVVVLRPNSTMEQVHNAVTMKHNATNKNTYNHEELKK